MAPLTSIEQLRREHPGWRFRPMYAAALQDISFSKMVQLLLDNKMAVMLERNGVQVGYGTPPTIADVITIARTWIQAHNYIRLMVRDPDIYGAVETIIETHEYRSAAIYLDQLVELEPR